MKQEERGNGQRCARFRGLTSISKVGHIVWRGNHCRPTPRSRSSPKVPPQGRPPRPRSAHPTPCLESRPAEPPTSVRPRKGEILILIPRAIPPRQKRHPQNSEFLSPRLPGSPGAVRRPQPCHNLTLYKLFTDILLRCTRCGCGYQLWDCLPHPPFCITLSQTVYKNQITMVLRSQPAQSLHTRLTHALEDAVRVQSSQQTTHELVQSSIYLPYLIFAEVNYTEFFFFFFTLFKANTQMTGCCWRKIWAFISYYY